MDVSVSIVIPARNAAATLGATLASLLAQTHPGWEAVVIDDGSTDGTAALAAELAARDPRIRLERTPGLGVSTARNLGIGLARSSWLLFLDADDWIDPRYLETMTAALASGDGVDGTLCGWRFAAPDGRLGPGKHCPEGRDLFALFATHCAFAIHACVVRRALAEAVGGFDPGLATCEDWDFWQRVARTGACFARVPEALAVYRMRPGSASLDPARLLADGLRVIDRGHADDRRGLPAARFLFASWAAGLALGRGEEALPLLDAVDGTREPGLDPEDVAGSIIQAALLPGARLPEEWTDLWPQIEDPLDAFLAGLEERSGTAGLARRGRRALERMAIEASWEPSRGCLTLGSMHAVRFEVTEPLRDLRAAPPVERLRALVTVEGEPIGHLELPVIAGLVPADLLADAVAADLSWEILRRFLARSTPGRFGWDVFLQELWGRPGWPMATFYDPAAVREEAPRRQVEAGWIEIEAAQELPALALDPESPAEALLRIGGAVAAAVPLPAQPILGAHELRAALTQAGGFEICRAAVREAVLGQPLDAPGSLRERLAAAARHRAPAAEGCAAVLGRSPGAPVGSAASRRARLPVEALPELRDLAATVGQELLEAHGDHGCVTYAPELIRPRAGAPPRPQPGSPTAPAAPLYGRGHFEALFAAGPDPWRYTSPYEETKYEQTLSLLPEGPLGRALELACAEGHFTARLAPRVGHLTAADISRIALERTGQRCAGAANLELRQMDLTRDPLPEGLDLIVCSEVLYYVGDRAALADVAGRFARALAPGGWLLTAHANLVADDPDRTGFDWPHPFGARVIGETLAAAGGLRLVRELRTPLYRVQLFRREPVPAEPPRPPDVYETADLPPLPPEVAVHVLWKGGAPRQVGTAVTTSHLPILLFHRVAPEGGAGTARWRLTPDAFEERLRFLSDSGYHTPRLADWRRAMESKEPLPGRAMLLTFDDGTRDFAGHAWPLLRRYGFSALVFLVADHIGGVNGWDSAYGEEVPLLAWDEIRRLRGEGVTFGSHTASHGPLTALCHAEVVREAARSRAVLTRGLGAPVDAIAWPHGAVDPAVRHLAGACGYVYGFSCRPARSGFDDPFLDLPRIEVSGTAGFDAFVRSLGDA
jgi:peptidoglycan/xylan/chitin deacetylase (PgdA/CDA1 family)/SAM-dependent methyltransferase